MKDTTPHIQETQWPTRRINIKKITLGTACETIETQDTKINLIVHRG